MRQKPRFINLGWNRLIFAMEVFRNPPEPSSFIPLAEHQSHTPASFYSGPPILHHLSERCKIVILEEELNKSTALNGLRPNASVAEAVNGTSASEASTSATATSTDGADGNKEIVIDGVDVWVTSEYGFKFYFQENMRISNSEIDVSFSTPSVRKPVSQSRTHQSPCMRFNASKSLTPLHPQLPPLQMKIQCRVYICNFQPTARTARRTRIWKKIARV